MLPMHQGFLIISDISKSRRTAQLKTRSRLHVIFFDCLSGKSSIQRTRYAEIGEFPECLVQVGNDIELLTVGCQFGPYR